MGSARGLVMRNALTVIQVGLAVTLVSVGMLYARTYRSLSHVEKGFESGALAVVSTIFPPRFFAGRAGGIDASRRRSSKASAPFPESSR